MDMNRAATLMTRAAWSAVIALPVLLLVNSLEEKEALRECLMEELMGEYGDRQAAEASYRLEGQAAITTSAPRLRLHA